jgi:hypothetical protein
LDRGALAEATEMSIGTGIAAARPLEFPVTKTLANTISRLTKLPLVFLTKIAVQYSTRINAQICATLEVPMLYFNFACIRVNDL